MEDIKNISLSRCLMHANLKELPKQRKDDVHWLEAVALVKKLDYTLSYALIRRGADGRIVYTHDFGHISPIISLVSIHPYIILDKKRYLPCESIEEMRAYLTQIIGGDDKAVKAVGMLSDSDVEYQLLNRAIKSQYRDIENGESHTEDNDENACVESTQQIVLDSVDVNTKQTITLEDKEQNEETDNNDDAGDVSEPSERSGEEYTEDGDTVPAENPQAVEPNTPEEKPKNKGGRPKGGKNNTTRRTTNK